MISLPGRALLGALLLAANSSHAEPTSPETLGKQYVRALLERDESQLKFELPKVQQALSEYSYLGAEWEWTGLPRSQTRVTEVRVAGVKGPGRAKGLEPYFFGLGEGGAFSVAGKAVAIQLHVHLVTKQGEEHTVLLALHPESAEGTPVTDNKQFAWKEVVWKVIPHPKLKPTK